MGVLTELVIASIEDAAAVAQATSPSQRWPGVDLKGHNSVTLGQLMAILRDVEWTTELFDNELVASGGDQGPWVTTVPADFVAEVRAIPDERLDELAEAWSVTEELDGCTPALAREALVNIRDLCRRAEDRRLLMWMSL